MSHGPFGLCLDATEWHRHLGRMIDGCREPRDQYDDGLFQWVEELLGASLLHSHRWAYTAGSGAALDILLDEVSLSRGNLGAVLPTYQRVVRAVGRRGMGWCVHREVESWDDEDITVPSGADVIYLSPLHSNPVARRMRTAAVRPLVSAATAGQIEIIEDDAFRGLDDADHVPIAACAPDATWYLGSLTKQLGWPVKLGFIGIPRASKRVWPDSGVDDGQRRRAEAVFRSGRAGAISRHRSKRFRSRQADVAALLMRHGIAFVPPTGGMHLLAIEPTAAQHRALVTLGGIPGGAFGVNDASFVRLGLSTSSPAAWPSDLERLDRALASS